MSLRSEKKQETRERILAVANDSFRRKGFHESTVREIARAVRVSEPTFYNYFTDKDAVLDALALEWLAKSNNLVLTSSKNSSAVRVLRRYIAKQCDMILSDPDFAQLVVTRSSLFNYRPSPEARELARAGFRALAEVIERGQQSGEIRSDMAAIDLAVALHGATTLVVRLWVTDFWPRAFDLKKKATAVLDLLVDR